MLYVFQIILNSKGLSQKQERTSCRVDLGSKITYGVFKTELKNRFLCIVNINNEDTLCYIPSSCKLSNFIDINNRIVMLLPVSKKARTKYSIYAVKYRKSFIVLNLSMANDIIAEQLHRRMFNFLGKRNGIKKEKTIDGYKSDLYIEETDTIIEVKSLLSFDQKAIVPTVFSERANRQLECIKKMLSRGRKVCYIFVSMYSGVKQIYINPAQKEYYKLFCECIEAGMSIVAFSVYMHFGCPLIKKQITIEV